MSDVVEPKQFRNLFIGGLDYKSTKESVNSHFEQWGEIVDSTILKNRNNCKYGFVIFKRAHMVDDVQAARPHVVDGREVETKRAIQREDSGKPEYRFKITKLFINRIKDDFEEKDFRDYFGEYGSIVNVNIITDKYTGKKRGFAFVEFNDWDPVDKVLLTKHIMKGHEIEVKKALSRAQFYRVKVYNSRGSSGRSRGGGGNNYGGGFGGGGDNYDGGGYSGGFGGGGDNYGGGSYSGGFGGDYGRGPNTSADGGNGGYGPNGDLMGSSSGYTSGRSRSPYGGGGRSGGYSSYGR